MVTEALPPEFSETELHDTEGNSPHDALLGSPHTRMIAIGGGKGGVGKSLLTANVGMYLSQLGNRVVLVDLDVGGANLHTFVGVERPQKTLGDLFRKRVSRIEDCIVETAIQGLGLISAEGDPLWMSDPRPHLKKRLLQGIGTLHEVDFILFDLPAGSGIWALDFFTLAHKGVLVVAPEPTSAENAYRFLKSAFLRKLRALRPTTPEEPTPYMLAERMNLIAGQVGEGGIPAPLDVYDALLPLYPEQAARVAQEMQNFNPGLVVNQARSRSDGLLGEWMRSAGRQRLGIPIDYFGSIDSDDSVWQAIRKRKPLLPAYPESKVCQQIEQIARRLMDKEQDRKSPWKHPGSQTMYELLEVEPGSSDEEIRRAVRRMREMLAPDSMVLRGLYTEDRLAAFHKRIDEAYDTLLHVEKRHRYDVALFPEGAPIKSSRSGAKSSSLPSDLREFSLPAITPDTEFTGELLRKIREAYGLTLTDIASQTKVNVSQLQALEMEAQDRFPAFVYLRGFLAQYAKCLHLDATQVTTTYLARMKKAE